MALLNSAHRHRASWVSQDTRLANCCPLATVCRPLNLFTACNQAEFCVSRERESVVGTSMAGQPGAQGDSFLLRCTIMPQSQSLESIGQRLAEWEEELQFVIQGEVATLELRTANPGRVIACLLQTACVARLVLENLAAAMLVEPDRQVVDAEQELAAPQASIGVVPFVPGTGFAQLFRQADSAVVPLQIKSNMIGTAMFELDEILETIGQLPYRSVLLLPNDGALWEVAETVAARANQLLAPREVFVVPTKTAPQGLAALTSARTATTEPAALALQMQEHIARIDTGEVWQAVQDAEFDGVAVEVGDFIGLHDGRLVTRGHHLTDVVFSLLEQMAADESTTITLYYGDFITAEAAENLKETVCNRYADQSVDLAYGGQAHCHYILSTE